MCKRANNTVDLQEVWVQEINVNYVHEQLTGDVHQPHYLESNSTERLLKQ